MRGKLMQAYEEVQRRKDEALPAFDPAVVVQVKRALKRQLQSDDPQLIATALQGMAWVIPMLMDAGLDGEEAMDVPEQIVANTVLNMPAGISHRVSFKQAIELGVGAGFYTGLWTGLILGGRS